MKYLRDKIMFFLIALLSALIINFILPRMMPGDPAERILMKMGGEIQPEAVDAMKIALGVDKETPLLQQFFSYLKNTLTFNFGISYSYYPVPVKDLILNSLPWTIGLVGISTLISFVLGTSLGIRAGWNRNKPIDSFITICSLIIRGFPYFWLALILLVHIWIFIKFISIVKCLFYP